MDPNLRDILARIPIRCLPIACRNLLCDILDTISCNGRDYRLFGEYFNLTPQQVTAMKSRTANRESVTAAILDERPDWSLLKLISILQHMNVTGVDHIIRFLPQSIAYYNREFAASTPHPGREGEMNSERSCACDQCVYNRPENYQYTNHCSDRLSHCPPQNIPPESGGPKTNTETGGREGQASTSDENNLSYGSQAACAYPNEVPDMDLHDGTCDSYQISSTISDQTKVMKGVHSSCEVKGESPMHVRGDSSNPPFYNGKPHGQGFNNERSENHNGIEFIPPSLCSSVNMPDPVEERHTRFDNKQQETRATAPVQREDMLAMANHSIRTPGPSLTLPTYVDYSYLQIQGFSDRDSHQTLRKTTFDGDVIPVTYPGSCKMTSCRCRYSVEQGSRSPHVSNGRMGYNEMNQINAMMGDLTAGRIYPVGNEEVTRPKQYWVRGEGRDLGNIGHGVTRGDVRRRDEGRVMVNGGHGMIETGVGMVNDGIEMMKIQRRTPNRKDWTKHKPDPPSESDKQHQFRRHSSDESIHRSDQEVIYTRRRQIPSNFVLVTGGQTKKSSEVEKGIEELVSVLRQAGITVLAHLGDEFICPGIDPIPIHNSMRESLQESLLDYFKQATCIVMVISPGYKQYVEKDSAEPNPTNHQIHSRLFYTQMLNEYCEVNRCENKRFFPVMLKALGTTSKHVPDWLKATLRYTFPSTNDELIKHLKIDLDQ